MVGGSHRQRHVTNRRIDLILSTHAWLIGEDLHPITLIRREPALAITGNETAQTLAAVKQTELRPYIHQPVRRGRAGQPDPALHKGPHFHQRREPLRTMVFEAGEFVDDNHVERPRAPKLANEPWDVFAVDDGYHRRRRESVQPVLFGANSDRDGEPVKVIPLRYFGGPGIAGYPQWCDDEDSVDGEVVEHELPDRRQRDH